MARRPLVQINPLLTRITKVQWGGLFAVIEIYRQNSNFITGQILPSGIKIRVDGTDALHDPSTPAVPLDFPPTKEMTTRLRAWIDEEAAESAAGDLPGISVISPFVVNMGKVSPVSFELTRLDSGSVPLSIIVNKVTVRLFSHLKWKKNYNGFDGLYPTVPPGGPVIIQDDRQPPPVKSKSRSYGGASVLWVRVEISKKGTISID